jgi:DNA-binding XRE family transcriptional regulator
MQRDALEYFRQLRAQDPELQAEYERLKPRFDLVDELIRARKQAGLTQADLARRAGVSRHTIASLESAEHSPRLETVVAVARALGRTVEVRLT